MDAVVDVAVDNGDDDNCWVVAAVMLVPGAVGVGVVKDEEEEDEVTVWGTVIYAEALLSQVARTWGFEGKTSKRPTPSSQQKARRPSQQKEVSVLVTLEHEMRSCPPALAPGLCRYGQSPCSMRGGHLVGSLAATY
jgi:hypothetical protein